MQAQTSLARPHRPLHGGGVATSHHDDEERGKDTNRRCRRMEGSGSYDNLCMVWADGALPCIAPLIRTARRVGTTAHSPLAAASASHAPTHRQKHVAAMHHTSDSLRKSSSSLRRRPLSALAPSRALLRRQRLPHCRRHHPPLRIAHSLSHAYCMHMGSACICAPFHSLT